ncbi:MAG: hypothetical protein H6909_03110 [Rickettsiaceae bacterium]|nr:hypothetical protein [Rickettsiaceae bacterium]
MKKGDNEAKKEIAQKANLDLIVSDDIELLAASLQNSELPTHPDVGHIHELTNNSATGTGYNLQERLPGLLSEGKNKSIYINDDGHWIGLYYNAHDKKLYFIDSYGHDYNDYKKTAAQIKESLKNYPEIKIENLYKQKIQFADYDKRNCGRFLGMTLVLLDHGIKPEEFQRLDSSVIINTPKMTNASLTLAKEIDTILFTYNNQDNEPAIQSVVASQNLRAALTKYMKVVNQEVKQQIIEKTSNIIYDLADKDEKQARAIIESLQNFVREPNTKNIEELDQFIKNINVSVIVTPKNPDIDREGFSITETNKAIQKSLEIKTISPKNELNNPVDTKNLPSTSNKVAKFKKKIQDCRDAIALFKQTITKAIEKKFSRSLRTKLSPSSRTSGQQR